MTLSAQTTSRTDTSPIRPLTIPDLAGLRLRRHFRFDTGDIKQILETNPGSSFWVPDTDELILVGNWRNRSDLHAIHGMAATANEAALIERAMSHAAEAGIAAMMMVDIDEIRRPAFYIRHEMVMIDHITTYELSSGRILPPGNQAALPDVRFVRVSRDDRAAMREVVALDNVAFPWFWWNVDAEFDSYLAQDEVEVWLGYLDNRPVSYFGITHYRGWGHLDRIATHPDAQRGGIGAATLEVAIRILRNHGARRIALSTQGENVPAQRMYERRGFHRTPDHDYTVRGRILDQSKFGQTHAVRQETARGGNHRVERDT